MDHTLVSRWIRYGQNFYTRTKQLSADPAKGPSRWTRLWIAHARKVLGIGLMLVSLILGSWAYDGTWEQAFRQGKTHDVPSEIVWEQTLRAAGFSPAPEALLPRLLRTLPVQAVEQADTVWFSPEGAWFARPLADGQNGMGFYVRLASQANPRRVSLATPTDPQQWTLLGKGWDALTGLMAILDTPAHPKADPSPKKSRTYRDPRAIHY